MRVIWRIEKAVIPILDNIDKINAVDKSGMINFCVNSATHYKKALEISKKIVINYPKPDNIVICGMGGSAIGGDLLKDWAKEKSSAPIEINRDYQLPSYANKKTLVFIMSYSGETEESLSSFLDALRRKCMIYCVSSGGTLLKYAKKLKVPYLQVPGGMPPRAALPYMFTPLLIYIGKIGLGKDVFDDFNQTLNLLEKISKNNSPDKFTKENFTKKLAVDIGKTVPVVYGFGFYRGVAQRFKQQFNENSKVPAKWEFFPELNHNEIVGWEDSSNNGNCFSVIFFRDKDEPVEIKSRIEATKRIIGKAGLKMFDIPVMGKCELAKIISTIIVGDFTSIYLAVQNEVDPTPVRTITNLKETIKESRVKEKVIRELDKF